MGESDEAASQQKARRASYKIPIFSENNSEKHTDEPTSGAGYYLNVAQKGKLILPTALWLLLILAGFCFISLLVSLNRSIDTLDTLVELEQAEHAPHKSHKHGADNKFSADSKTNGFPRESPPKHHKRPIASDADEGRAVEQLFGEMLDDVLPNFDKLVAEGEGRDDKRPTFANLGNMFVHLADPTGSGRDNEREDSETFEMRKPKVSFGDETEPLLETMRWPSFGGEAHHLPLGGLVMAPAQLRQRHRIVLQPDVSQLVAALADEPQPPSRETHRFGLSNTRRPTSESPFGGWAPPYELRSAPKEENWNRLSDELAGSFLDSLLLGAAGRRQPKEKEEPTTVTTTVLLDGRPFAAPSDEPHSAGQQEDRRTKPTSSPKLDMPTSEMGELFSLMFGPPPPPPTPARQQPEAKNAKEELPNVDKPFEVVEIKPVEQKQSTAAPLTLASQPQLNGNNQQANEGVNEVLGQLLTLAQFGGASEQRPTAAQGNSSTSSSSSGAPTARADSTGEPPKGK